MKKDGILVSGIIAILILVVMASGCTNTQTGDQTGSGEKVIVELNLPKVNSSDSTLSRRSNYNVTIPEGAKSVKIKYQGLQTDKTNIGGTDISSMATLGVFALNIVPTEGQDFADFTSNAISSKSVDVGGGESDGTIEFNQTGIKGVFIAGVNVKGKIIVSVTT